VTSVDVTEGSACPSTRKADENMAQIREFVHENKCIIIRELAASTVRYAAKTTREVSHWRVVSPPRQCCHPLWFVCAGISDPNGTNVVSHPPYSSDMAPCDFVFKFKLALTGRLGEVIAIQK